MMKKGSFIFVLSPFEFTFLTFKLNWVLQFPLMFVFHIRIVSIILNLLVKRNI